MFKEIKIENLRGIGSLEVNDFRQINLFVGENNSGKTTLLESIFLLIGPTNPELFFRINFFRGLDFIDADSWLLNFKGLKKNTKISISGELKPFEKRRLTISPDLDNSPQFISSNKKNVEQLSDSKSTNHEIVNGLNFEYSFRKTERKVKPQKINLRVKPDSTTPGVKVQVKKGSPEYFESLRGIFLNSKSITTDIADRFNSIQLRKEKKQIVEVLRKIEPSLEDITVSPEGIIYCDIGYDNYLPLNVMGDGMVRLLAIVLAITDSKNGVVLIDEIENGFYYSYQKILWETIFETAEAFKVQIFATTHSLECIEALLSTVSKIKNKESLRLYRLERKKDRSDQYKSILYSYDKLENSLQGGWEVR